MVGRLADQAVTDGIDEGQLTDYATMRAQLRADLAPPAKRARQQMPAAASAPEFSLIGCYAKNTGSPPGAMQAPAMPPPPPEPVDEAEAERRQKRAARFRVVQPKAGGSDKAAAAAPAPTVAPDRTKGPEHQWCILDNPAGAAQREPDLVQQGQFPKSLGLPPLNRAPAVGHGGLGMLVLLFDPGRDVVSLLTGPSRVRWRNLGDAREAENCDCGHDGGRLLGWPGPARLPLLPARPRRLGVRPRRAADPAAGGGHPAAAFGSSVTRKQLPGGMV